MNGTAFKLIRKNREEMFAAAQDWRDPYEGKKRGRERPDIMLKRWWKSLTHRQKGKWRIRWKRANAEKMKKLLIKLAKMTVEGIEEQINRPSLLSKMLTVTPGRKATP